MCQAKRDFGNSLGNFAPEKYGEYQFGIPAGAQDSNAGLVIVYKPACHNTVHPVMAFAPPAPQPQMRV
jgi:hypothetical protein